MARIGLDFTGLELKTRQDEGRLVVFDPIRKKWLILTPEEQVRQLLIQYFIHKIGYPSHRLAIEKTITIGRLVKRFDIVVYDRETQPWLLVECKAPEIPITEKTLFQLLNYQQVIQSPFWLLSNGHQTFCADAQELTALKWIANLPTYPSQPQPS